MATTNMPSDTDQRSADERRAVAEANKNSAKAASSGGGDVSPDLDKQARDAVIDRAHANFDGNSAGARMRLNAELQNVDPATRKSREDEFQAKADLARKDAVDRAIAVYEGAIKRRGAHQAAMDQLQGAVGLPTDPELRQREIERRTEFGDASMRAQSGVGTVAGNLEGGPIGTRSDVFMGDQSRAEFNPHVQEGHGQNVASMARASARLQEVAPNAPMTQENVNDPHGANDRLEKAKAEQSKQNVTARVSGDDRTTVPPASQRIDQRGGPGGHPATEGGLQASDPLMPKGTGQARQTEATGQPKTASEGDQQARRQDPNAPKQNAEGLTADQLAQRDRVATGRDPS